MELLVVISIIALLIALLLPALQGARQTALMVRCMGNLRQLHLATEMYMDDNDRWIPSTYGDHYYSGDIWMRLIATYLEEGQISSSAYWLYDPPVEETVFTCPTHAGADHMSEARPASWAPTWYFIRRKPRTVNGLDVARERDLISTNYAWLVPSYNVTRAETRSYYVDGGGLEAERYRERARYAHLDQFNALLFDGRVESHSWWKYSRDHPDRGNLPFPIRGVVDGRTGPFN